MRILQVVIAGLFTLAASGIVSAVSLLVRDVLQVEPDSERLDQED